MYDYLIVGAGFFGAVFAREMTDHGKKCLIIDRRPHIGGNCYTKQIEGINVHKYGAHIFHTSDKEVWDYVNRFAEFNSFINSPIAVYGNEIYNLPFNMNTFSKMWAIKTPEEAREIISRQIREYGITNPQNLEEQAQTLVGSDIYNKLIKGYTEKQWGRKCTELPAFLIRRLPLRYTYDNNYFSDRYQGIPVGGYTPIFEKLLAGVEVHLSTEFNDVRNCISAAKTVFCGCIDEFFDRRFGALEYRSLRFETKVMDCENYQGNAVVNYTSADVPYTRVIEHKHFEFGNQKKTVITWEYPEQWAAGKEPYYPINSSENDSLYRRYANLAKETPDVIFGGRLGEYRYYDMDKVIRTALDAVKHELSEW